MLEFSLAPFVSRPRQVGNIGSEEVIVISRVEGSGTAKVLNISLLNVSSENVSSDDYTIDFTGLGAEASVDNAGNITNLEIPADQTSITIPFSWLSVPGLPSITYNLVVENVTTIPDGVSVTLGPRNRAEVEVASRWLAPTTTADPALAG